MCRQTKLPLERPKNPNAPNLLKYEKCKKTSIERASRMQSEKWIRFKAESGTLESQPVIGSAKLRNLKVCPTSKQMPVRRFPPSLSPVLLPEKWADGYEAVALGEFHNGVGEG
jgi:hypothetical protein